MGRGRAGAGQGQVGGAWAVAVEVLRAWARNKLMARLMGRGSAAARLRDMGRGSAGENLKGRVRVRLRGMGRSSVGEVEGHGQEQYRGKFERYGQGQCTG